MMTQKQEVRKHWFFGTLLMMTILWFGSMPAYADTKGVLDPANGNSISGWAWDSNSPDSALQVTVKVTNRSNGEVVLEQSAAAGEYREDLSKKGTGTGKYGFSMALPLDTLSDGSYLIEASANGRLLTNQRYYTPGSSSQLLGVFKITGYCPCGSCSEGWGRRTSSGATATASHTIAVDPRVIPMGSRVVINGTTYTAEDRGGGVKGNHIDIYYNTHGETRAQGVSYSEVYMAQ